jgi:hypothetical protein
LNGGPPAAILARYWLARVGLARFRFAGRYGCQLLPGQVNSLGGFRSAVVQKEQPGMEQAQIQAVEKDAFGQNAQPAQEDAQMALDPELVGGCLN